MTIDTGAGVGRGAARPPRGGGAVGLRSALVALLLASAGCATLQGLWGGGFKGPPPPPWVAYPAESVAGVENPHNYLGGPLCQRCHTGPSGTLRAQPIALCKECHPQRHGNHPVDLIHKTPSKELPYGDGHRIVCHTCHDQHRILLQKNSLRLPFNELCLKCHVQH